MSFSIKVRGEMRRTVTIADTIVSMTFAMAEMMALMPPPMAETMEPLDKHTVSSC